MKFTDKDDLMNQLRRSPSNAPNGGVNVYIEEVEAVLKLNDLPVKSSGQDSAVGGVHYASFSLAELDDAAILTRLEELGFGVMNKLRNGDDLHVRMYIKRDPDAPIIGDKP